ncbi:YveK family protein [Brochothrix thermosphacta]|uniref:YveK family protein n=1 Tax=Brochothrix thermosphacta TaxID=2756 RepID=UPI000D7A4452|nr:Wzz/FepE/Etk N-terminal domain-containing protein [Brochothrix thermosphacta]SPN74922.1 putative Capsular polysaccharide biosynthesis protein CapA [Brochothrix thermosphacta]
MTETIGVKQIWNIISQGKKILFASTFICLLISATYAFVIATPMYSNSAQILVNQTNRTTNGLADVQVDLSLVDTYTTIITSPRILNEVNHQLNGDYSIEGLTKMLRIESDASSQVIKISAVATSPKIATEIVNTVVQVFKEQVPTIMSVNNVSILSEARVMNKQKQIQPQKQMIMIVGFLAGIISGVLIVLARFFWDTTIKEPEELQAVSGLPLLGVIPHFNQDDVFEERGRKK